MPHILYLHQYYCPAGGWGNNRSYELAREWVKNGWRVTVITSTAYFPPDHPAHSHPVYRFEENGAQIIVVRAPYQQEMGYLRRIWAFLAFFVRAFWVAKSVKCVDMIYASSTPLTVGELGRRLARKMRVPYVFEAVDVWPDAPIGMGIIQNRLLIKGLNALTDRIYRQAASIVTLSEGMKAQIAAHGVAENKIIVSHNGTDTALFHPTERKPSARVRVIYAGAIGAANDVGALIEAAKVLENENVAFEIYGWGSELEKVKALAQKLDCKNVNFHPPIPKNKLNELFNSADIGVVTFAPYPVLEANSANKFFDYLSAGLPVVINYEGWQAEYLKSYGCGLSSPQGDAATFAENLRKLIGEPALRLEMGQNARRLACERFERRDTAAKLLAEFERILTGKQK